MSVDPRSTYEVTQDGRHSFATGVGDQRVLISMPLTGRQVAFLLSNPAAARCCLAKSWITSDWLDQLILATESAPFGGVH